MNDDQFELPPIPETEQDVIDMMEADLGRDLTEQEQNVAVAQAEIIGDL